MVRGRFGLVSISLYMVYLHFITWGPSLAAGTPAALGTYPSQGQGSNPGLDFLHFSVIFELFCGVIKRRIKAAVTLAIKCLVTVP